MSWSDRHPLLATLRKLFAIPLGAATLFLLFGVLLRAISGGSPDVYCNDKGTLFLIGLVIWMWSILGSIKVTGGQRIGSRIILGLWNSAGAGALLLLVFIVFVVDVGGCSD